MEATEAWLHLRNTLAHPPGAAGSRDERRRSLYVACIQQFEQLVVATRAIAAHARPLPLYYAAMHASKALSAAFGQHDHPRWHGLRQSRGAVAAEVMEFEIVPDDEKSSVLTALCDLTGSGRIAGSVRLGDIFLSLPDLSEKPHDLVGARPLHVDEIPPNLDYYPVPENLVHVLIETAEEPDPALYPTLEGWHRQPPTQVGISSRRRSAIQFGRPGEYLQRHALLDELAPTYRLSGERWLIPRIEGTTKLLSPLVAWYSLLFGFSILARYEPDTWLAALDVQRPHAVAIQAALEEATEALPELVWKHIATVLAEERLANEG